MFACFCLDKPILNEMNHPHCLQVFDWVTSSHSFNMEFHGTSQFQNVQVSHGNFHPFESGIPQLPVDFKLFRYLTETPTPSKVEFHSNLSISICSGISRKLPPLRKWNSAITCRFQTVQVMHGNFHPTESQTLLV